MTNRLRTPHCLRPPISRYSTYMDVEVTRARYRPDRITTLFVGESAPASGAFFYHGDSAMLRYMQRATEAALGVGAGHHQADRVQQGKHLPGA
jgi:hypothetical protein